MLKRCKRMTIYTYGVDRFGDIEYARNGNTSECRNIPGNCGCIHAEINLLEKMPHPERVWVSHSPCLNCSKALHRAGVKKVYYTEPYRILDGIKYLESNGVEVKKRTKPDFGGENIHEIYKHFN